MKALALSAIRSQISQDNIIEEIFSKFTSRYPGVQMVELAFLSDHIRSVPVKLSLRNVMKRVVRGELPHAAGILTAIIETPTKTWGTGKKISKRLSSF